MTQLLAFHNDPKIQKKYVDRVNLHYKLDEIIQGRYWERGRGCAVGCTVQTENSPHYAMEKEIGVSRQLAYLEDRIFEGLDNGEAKKFPVRFINAINLGADLSQVLPKFMVWLLADKNDGVIKYARPDGVEAIKKVVSLYKKKLKGGNVSSDEWLAVREECLNARRNAVYDAYADAAVYAAAVYDAYAYAAYAAAVYADAAAYAAYAAAVYADAAAYVYAVYDAAAYAAARRLYYKKMADKLIKLLKSAK